MNAHTCQSHSGLETTTPTVMAIASLVSKASEMEV